MIIVCAVFLAVYSNAAMSISTFNSKLSSFRSSRYAHNSTYVDDPSNTGGYQCFGYANELAKYIFGSYPTSSMGALSVNSGWTRKYGSSAIDTLAVGDIVRYWYHSIFITGINGDTITYCQANVPSGTNKVTYDNTISRSTLKSRVSDYLTHDGASTTGWVAHYNNGVTPGTTQTVYNITYYIYEATENVPSNTTITTSTYTLPSAAPRGFKYSFRYWISNDGNYYAPGDTINIYGDTTIYNYTSGAPEWLDMFGYSDDAVRFASKGKGQAWFEISSQWDRGGKYEIYSRQKELGADYTDTVGNLYDENGNHLAWNDDGKSGNDFSIVYDLESGKKYYLSAEFFSSSRSGDINVSIRRLCTIKYAGESVNIPEVTKRYGEDITVSDQVPTMSGYSFGGWTTSKGSKIVVYNPGEACTHNSGYNSVCCLVL